MSVDRGVDFGGGIVASAGSLGGLPILFEQAETFNKVVANLRIVAVRAVVEEVEAVGVELRVGTAPTFARRWRGTDGSTYRFLSDTEVNSSCVKELFVSVVKGG